MTKVKIINIVKAVNTIAIIILSIIFLIGSGFTLLAILTSKSFQVAMFGFLIALIFGILAYKKSYFLWFSMLGWLIFGLGNNLDIKEAVNKNNQACIELRQDQNCTEVKDGTIDCISGENLGIYPQICKGLIK